MLPRPQLFKPFELKGLASLDANIVKFVGVIEETAKVAGQEAGKIFKEEWQSQQELVLIHGYWTGAYQGSIEIEDPVLDGTTVSVIVSSNPEGLENPNYPDYLEYGWSKVPRGYPTMMPAFEAKKDEAVAAGEMIIAEVVDSMRTIGFASSFTVKTAALIQSTSATESIRAGKTLGQIRYMRRKGRL